MWRHVNKKLNYIKLRRKCELIVYNIFLQLDPHSFKLVCLIKISSKFMQEKTKIFISYVHCILFFQLALINNQPNAFFPNICFNYFRVNFSRWRMYRLTLSAPYISESYIKIKINLNCYFQTSLWCLKRFYEGLKDLEDFLKALLKALLKILLKALKIFFSSSGIGAQRFNVRVLW